LKAYASESEALAAFSPALRARKAAAARVDVLCVTSSADLLAYLGQLLHHAGYAVSSTDNLAEAETMLAAKPKFLVIDASLSATVSSDCSLRERFNALIDGVSIVELPSGFASSDAGDAARQLVKQLRTASSGR